MDSFCVKCKERRELKDPITVVVEGKRGKRTFLKGVCAVCGSKVAHIVKAV